MQKPHIKGWVPKSGDLRDITEMRAKFSAVSAQQRSERQPAVAECEPKADHVRARAATFSLSGNGKTSRLDATLLRGEPPRHVASSARVFSASLKRLEPLQLDDNRPGAERLPRNIWGGQQHRDMTGVPGSRRQLGRLLWDHAIVGGARRRV
ncbi:hypothetical protein CCHR01_02326 [Colletotrichum chrysophilum]|uniref:Uncharacterized protein n=1 Tax=Colletotrichum chrysophilum TaxID=1836956 RepID=A0AAD9AUY5_9PEZI|nr:hypothetical protein CCHR01_02326 [Colletotrichum chrysophilum]